MYAVDFGQERPIELGLTGWYQGEDTQASQEWESLIRPESGGEPSWKVVWHLDGRKRKIIITGLWAVGKRESDGLRC